MKLLKHLFVLEVPSKRVFLLFSWLHHIFIHCFRVHDRRAHQMGQVHVANAINCHLELCNRDHTRRFDLNEASDETEDLLKKLVILSIPWSNIAAFEHQKIELFKVETDSHLG